MITCDDKIGHLFDFYRERFIPAYADLVGYVGGKPLQVSNELDNVLSHLAQCYNPNFDDAKKNENVDKALNHLTRVTLDCYKLLWVDINKILVTVAEDSKRGFSLTALNQILCNSIMNSKTKHRLPDKWK